MLKIMTKKTPLKIIWIRKSQKLKEDESLNHSFPPSAFENILFHLNALKQSQEIFDQFMQIVEEDIKKKTKVLKSVKKSDQLSTNQKTYASVQCFMLKCYLNRIKIFQQISDNSITGICSEYCKDGRDDEKVGDLVNKHVDALEKMKRRMKHMLDVSEKYAVIDLFSAISVLDEKSGDLDPSKNLKDSKDRRLTRSVTSFCNNTYRLPDSPSFSRVSSTSPSSASSLSCAESDFGCPEILFRKNSLRHFQSLSDHMCVLGKTYTDKQ